MTDDTTTNTVDESASKASMREFTHTNPYTGRTFGDEMAFERGPAVAADGGERDAAPSDTRPDDLDEAVESVADADVDGVTGTVTDGDGDAQTMDDVDHEHPHDDADEANRVFARGHSDDEGT